MTISLQRLEQLSQNELFKDNLMSPEQLHGFLCAVISNPVTVPIKTWLPAVFGNDQKLMGHEAAVEINQLAKQLHADIEHQLLHGETLLPLIIAEGKLVNLDDASNEQLASWAAGYMAGVSLNQQAWLKSGHHEIYALLTPISAFAQFFDNNQPQDAQGKTIDPEIVRADYLPSLPAAISSIFHFWRQHQHCGHHHVHHPVETLRHETPKTGRNDPCLCGSGKKFKKCCGV